MKKLLTRKAVSIAVMITFFSVFCLPAHPAQAKLEQALKTEKQEKKGKVEAEAKAEINEYYSRDAANVIEDEGNPGGTKKKKFPWLLVVGGIVVVGVVLYFLVIKKPKYDLTVNVGEGAAGNPSTGTYTYKKGETVSYSYSLQSGYVDLEVKVDGQSVSASGTINMDKDKTLTVSTTKVATVVVKSSPTGAQILINGSDTGETTNHTFTYTSGGSKKIILRKLGYKEYSTTVNAVLGQIKTVNKTLEQGLKEDFNSGATSSILWEWVPRSSGNWSVAGGNYVGDSRVTQWDYSVYAYRFTGTKYTLTVRMKRSQGNIFSSNSVLLAEGSSATAITGYLFNYTADGWVSAWRYRNKNFDTGSSSSVNAEIFWKEHGAVNKGLGNYNTFRIVRDDNNYTYYLNNKLIGSFTSALHDPGYIIIGGFNGNKTTKLEFDYVYLDIGNTAGSVPAPPASRNQSKAGDKGVPEYHK